MVAEEQQTNAKPKPVKPEAAKPEPAEEESRGACLQVERSIWEMEEHKSGIEQVFSVLARLCWFVSLLMLVLMCWSLIEEIKVYLKEDVINPAWLWSWKFFLPGMISSLLLGIGFFAIKERYRFQRLILCELKKLNARFE